MGEGKKRSRTSLELPETLFCLTDNNTPLKNPRIAGKTALVVIISKQNNRHKHKKGKSTKKIKQHNNNQDSNNRETNARNLGLERRCDETGLKGKQQTQER